MIVTLIGSARFEENFIEANRELALRGIAAFSLSAYPRDNGGKDWYSQCEKVMLDLVHMHKISNSDAVLVLGDGYLGFSTAREIIWANMSQLPIVVENEHEDWDEIAKTLSSRVYEGSHHTDEFLVRWAKQKLLETEVPEGT